MLNFNIWDNNYKVCMEESQQHDTLNGINHVLRALRMRNYRLFFFGQSFSLIGTWMQSIATSWLVYRITESAFLLGLAGFAGQIAAFFLAPLGGVIADRWNRRRILIMTQALSMIQSILLTLLFYTHTFSMPLIFFLIVLLGLINAVDIPVRHSFVLEMVEDKKYLGNAIALNSAIFNSARLIGPALAGILIAVYGEGICFSINTISYLPIIIALLLMRVAPLPRKSSNGNVLAHIKEGFIYAYQIPEIRWILFVIAMVCFIPYSILAPVYAKEVLGGESNIYGYLMAGTGLGAFIGAIALASRRSPNGLYRVITISSVMFGVGIIMLSFSRNVILAVTMTVIIGFGMMMQMSAGNTMLQTISDDDKRGRVMSMYTMAFMGAYPIGSLIGGAIAHGVGVPITYFFSGILCIVSGIVFHKKMKKQK
jgi:MFS family permease